MKYLISWKGYGEEENTWEIEQNLEGCKLLLKAYKEANGLCMPLKGNDVRNLPDA